MYEAFQARSARRVALARQALMLWRGCVDAHVVLAEDTSSLEEARELLERGVAAGERVLGQKPFDEDVGYFWSIHETRPYMRARAALAGTLWALNRREEAVAHQRDLLRLNPNDDQGLRYRQAEWLLWLQRYDELNELFAAYDSDNSAALAYTKALAIFRRHGFENAKSFLDEARAANPHVIAYLTGRKEMPAEVPAHVAFGDEDEAVEYVARAAALWARVPGALEWLEFSSTAPRRSPVSRLRGLAPRRR